MTLAKQRAATANKSVLYIVLTLGAFVALLPFLYMIANSLKTYSETVTRVSAVPFSPRFWPKKLMWENYARAWTTGGGLGRAFLNTVVIALVTLSGVVVTSSFAAYAFSKIKFPGKNVIFSVILATLMIPETVTLIPNFIIIANLGWVDKLPALTVPFMASGFFIFLLRQFFSQVPNALLESARMDGATHPYILARIFVPLSRAPMFTVTFLAFTGSWNALAWPLVVTQSPKWRPISVGLTKFITEAGPETHLRMAGAMIALLPVILVYFIAQRQITEAISRTGMKG
jgi:ABC-type glycerol-3-phosphate transport system permease component